jgi:hypothetical protein
VFAIALLASGQSSTIAGTYAGQFVMEVCIQTSHYHLCAQMEEIADDSSIVHVLGLLGVQDCSLETQFNHSECGDCAEFVGRHFCWALGQRQFDRLVAGVALHSAALCPVAPAEPHQ